MSPQPLKLHNGKTNIVDDLETELLGLARLYIDVYSIDAVCETMRDYHEPHVFGLFERRSVLKRMPDDVVIILFFAELHPSLREPLDLDADDLVEISLLFDIDMIEVMDTWTFEDVIRLNRELRTPAQMVPGVSLANNAKQRLLKMRQGELSRRLENFRAAKCGTLLQSGFWQQLKPPSLSMW